MRKLVIQKKIWLFFVWENRLDQEGQMITKFVLIWCSASLHQKRKNIFWVLEHCDVCRVVIQSISQCQQRRSHLWLAGWLIKLPQGLRTKGVWFDIAREGFCHHWCVQQTKEHIQRLFQQSLESITGIIWGTRNCVNISLIWRSHCMGVMRMNTLIVAGKTYWRYLSSQVLEEQKQSHCFFLSLYEIQCFWLCTSHLWMELKV